MSENRLTKMKDAKTKFENNAASDDVISLLSKMSSTSMDEWLLEKHKPPIEFCLFSELTCDDDDEETSSLLDPDYNPDSDDDNMTNDNSDDEFTIDDDVDDNKKDFDSENYWYSINSITSPGDDDKTNCDKNSVNKNLCWRIDPLKSNSDWTIKVRIKKPNMTVVSNTFADEKNNEGTSLLFENYHVHQHVLSRSSEYFSKLLLSSSTGSSNNNEYSSQKTFVVTLDENDAKEVPMILDYMYNNYNNNSTNNNNAFKITTKNAISLYHLADNFILPDLHKMIIHKIKSDISTNVKLLRCYYLKLKAYEIDLLNQIGDETKYLQQIEDGTQDLISHGVTVCVEKICHINPEFANEMTTNFFLHVVSETAKSLQPTSITDRPKGLHLGTLISKYVSYHKDKLTEHYMMSIAAGTKNKVCYNTESALTMLETLKVTQWKGLDGLENVCVHIISKDYISNNNEGKNAIFMKCSTSAKKRLHNISKKSQQNQHKRRRFD